MIFGDPTRIGFFTTAAYLSVAGMCSIWRHKTRIPRFFGVVAAVMFALGINKEADLQRPLLGAGRTFVEWALPDAPRTMLRLALVLVLVAGAAIAGLGLDRLCRAAPEDARLTLVGLGATTLFVVLRATSFVNVHVVHAFFRAHPNAVPWLELPGIVLVSLGAWRAAGAHVGHPRAERPLGAAPPEGCGDSDTTTDTTADSTEGEPT